MKYPGGKGKTYQQIINLIPPHVTYIEAFLGGGSVINRKLPAEKNIGIEINPDVLQRFENSSENNELICADAIKFLNNFKFTGNELVYCDPPYYPATRKRTRVYRYDFDTTDHENLLSLIKTLPCHVLISGYDNDLYREELSGWSKVDFNSKTHQGMRIESVWFNYEHPIELHDTRYLGCNFRERQNIRRRIDRLKHRIENLHPREKAVIRNWLTSTPDL